MYEYQNIKIFLQIVTLQIGEKKFFVIKRFKILCGGHMLLVNFTLLVLLLNYLLVALLKNFLFMEMIHWI